MRTKKRVTAIVVKDKKMLLVHRKKQGKEYWVVVGGGVEDGEKLEEALKREVLEETGLKVLNYSYLGEEIGEFEDLFYYYTCEVEEGTPKLGGPEKKRNNKNNWYNLEWMSLEKVVNLSLYPASTTKFIKTGSE